MPDPSRRALLACLLLLPAMAGHAQPAPAPTGAWVVEALGGAAPAGAAHRPDITFGDAGRVHGGSGCNRFMGGYTLDGAALRFGALAGTRMACEGPAMDLEQRFLDALASVRGWRADGASLLLTDAGGATLLRLVRG